MTSLDLELWLARVATAAAVAFVAVLTVFGNPSTWWLP